jgi:uncharacterized membrane protein
MPSNGESPGNRDALTLSYYEGKVLLYGTLTLPSGYFSPDTFYTYDLTLEKWTFIKTTNDPVPIVFQSQVVYKDAMYTFFGAQNNLYVNTIFMLNLTTYIWELVSSFPGFEYSTCQYFLTGSLVYMFNCRYGYTYLNSILSIDLSSSPLQITSIFSNTLFPRKRRDYCISALYNSIYVFGGIAEDDSTYLNDMWLLDVLTETWSQLAISGAVPSPRAGPACSHAYGLITLVGGYNGDTVYADMFVFNSKNASWIELNTANSFSARFGSCLIMTEKLVYIIAGATYTGPANDVVVYSYASKRYSYLKVSDKRSLGLVYHNCWMDKNDNNIIYVVAGEYAASTPNSKLLSLTVDRGLSYVKINTVMTDVRLRFARNRIIIANNFVYLLFGTLFSTILTSNITVIDLNSHKVVNSTDLGVYLYSFGALQMRRSIYTFGGGDHMGRVVRYSSAISTLYKITGSSGELPCSPGTFGQDCEFCPQGYFEDGSQNCQPCPKGTYSARIGLTSPYQCTICPFGTFSDKEGSTFCKDCPGDKFCFMGAKEPINSEEQINDVFTEQQAPSYQSQSANVNEIIYSVIFASVAVSILLILLLIFSRSFRHGISKLDIYSSFHEKTPENYQDRHTAIGGLFSAIAFIVVLLIGLYSLLLYSMENVAEYVALVPMILSESNIASPAVTVFIQLFNYGDSCSSSLIFITETSLAYDSQNINIGFPPGSNNDVCEITIEYSNLVINDTSIIDISLDEPYAYAAYIKFFVLSTSAVPGYNSSVSYQVTTDDKSKVFKGGLPTTLTLLVTPSVSFSQKFTSQFSAWPSPMQGFHLSKKQTIVKGSESSEEE